MKTSTRVTLLSLALAAFAPYSFATTSEVIKVVTPDGHVTYMGQKPATLPAGAKQSVVKSSGAEAVPAPAAAKDSGAVRPGFVRDDVDLANEDARKKNEEEKAKLNAANCNILKQNLDAYNLGRVAIAKPNGERSYLSDAELGASKARDEQAFKANCK